MILAKESGRITKFLLMMAKYLTIKARKMKIRKKQRLGVPYYVNPFQSRLERNNILTQRARKDAIHDCKI